MLGRSPLRLYTDSFRDSPWVFTAWLALTEKRLPFELVDVDLRQQEHKQPALLRLHTSGYALPDGLREYTAAQGERPSVKALRTRPRPALE